MKLKKLISAIKYVNAASLNLLLSGNGNIKNYLGKCRLEYYKQRSKEISTVPFSVVFQKCFEKHATVQIISENITGGLTVTELWYISSIVSVYPIKAIFEIGTFDGCTIAHIVMNNQFRETCIVYTLDLPQQDSESYSFDPENKPFLELRRPGYFINHYTPEQVNQLYGDSLKFDFTPYYESMDMVFIDGNHNMPFIQKDTENALKLLKPSGILLWHDYHGIPGDPVTDYLNHLSKTIPISRIENTSLAVYQKNDKNI